jgi:hypothetical protein
MNNAVRISTMSNSDLLNAWVDCVEKAGKAKEAVEEELRKGICIEVGLPFILQVELKIFNFL